MIRKILILIAVLVMALNADAVNPKSKKSQDDPGSKTTAVSTKGTPKSPASNTSTSTKPSGGKSVPARKTPSTASGNDKKETAKTDDTPKPIKRPLKYDESNHSLTSGDLVYRLVPVEGGVFRMGAYGPLLAEAESDEKPAHKVTLTESYYMGATEVPQWLWEAVMEANPCKTRGDNLPVVNVSWDDCATFIAKLNAKTGAAYRLPTEAEWEYAAREGKPETNSLYSGGDDLEHYGWYNHNSSLTSHNVGSLRPNALGLYDMSGNVWEWVSDAYGPYRATPQTDPVGSRAGYDRVARGGGWNDTSRYCRLSAREKNPANDARDDIGFRLVIQ